MGLQSDYETLLKRGMEPVEGLAYRNGGGWEYVEHGDSVPSPIPADLARHYILIRGQDWLVQLGRASAHLTRAKELSGDGNTQDAIRAALLDVTGDLS